ncbi:MAG: hypothetical protein WCK09_00365 [Bacteroidota bacterium]
MVSVIKYKSFWEYIARAFPAITKTLIIHEESDLPGIVRDMDNGATLLFAIIPSTDMEATSVDDFEEIDSCFACLIKKSDPGNLSADEFLIEMAGTQYLMSAIKDKMIALAGDNDHDIDGGQYSHLMHRLIINGMHTDPEYNLLGCNGWSLSFKLKTTGTIQ